LAEAQMVQSMSRKGNCWDNAVAESFFSTLEFEGPDTSTWRYVNDGEPELFRFIEGYYNQKRIHSHNGYKTPNETESDLRNGARVA
jgi:putative transposase